MTLVPFVEEQREYHGALLAVDILYSASVFTGSYSMRLGSFIPKTARSHQVTACELNVH